MLVPYSKCQVVLCPFGLTWPFSLALVVVTELAGFVVTLGAEAGVNVWSEPRLVPPSLVATSLKWYVRPVVRPETGAETLTGLVPEPAFCAAVVEP